MRKTLLLAVLSAPIAAHAADATSTFRFAPDPANMSACIALAPQLEREHTLTVAGDTVKITGPGDLSEVMKQARPNVYEAVLQLAGERLDYTADLAAKTVAVRGDDLGCKWSAKL